MATATAGTYLFYKTEVGSAYTKLVDITSYPDMGATPNKLDTTDLSATKFKTSIMGLQDIPDLTFECNYDKNAMATINSLEGDKLYLQLQFGTDGANGTFSWQGEVTVYAVGGGVDEVRKMMVVCSAETAIVAG